MNRFVVILSFVFACFSLLAYGQDVPEGVRPLQVLEKPVSTVMSPGITFIEDPKIAEEFLTNLEGQPPDWKYLFGDNVDERYDRLFDESEKRDARRVGNPTLDQPIAFLWDGFLTSAREDKPGFAVSIGPRHIQTSWGIVRFKIAMLPFEMTAMPSTEMFETIKQKRARKEEVPILIVFQGKLIPEESLMYDFSTAKEGEGMILPIVELTQVDYVLPSDHLRLIFC